MDILIDIKGLQFAYPDGTEVFNGLDFHLLRGQKVGIVGPNGVGKTTLFHIIMGLLRPQSGIIRIFKKDRKDEKDFHDVRRRIGLLFQDSDDQLFCPTVEEDIAFGPLNLGYKDEEVDKIVKDTCRTLGIGHLIDRITYRLSGGEKRLVALATVLAMRPECYLLDEPTLGLDKDKTLRIIHFLKEHTETAVIISHDREFLRETVQKVYRINKDRVTEVDL